MNIKNRTLQLYIENILSLIFSQKAQEILRRNLLIVNISCKFKEPILISIFNTFSHLTHIFFTKSCFNSFCCTKINEFWFRGKKNFQLWHIFLIYRIYQFSKAVHIIQNGVTLHFEGGKRNSKTFQRFFLWLCFWLLLLDLHRCLTVDTRSTAEGGANIACSTTLRHKQF